MHCGAEVTESSTNKQHQKKTVVQDDATTVPCSGGTYHVNGTERTADAGSPSGCVRGLVEGRSQCIKRGGERGSQLDFVPENYALGGRKVAVPLSCPYFTEPGRVG